MKPLYLFYFVCGALLAFILPLRCNDGNSQPQEPTPTPVSVTHMTNAELDSVYERIGLIQAIGYEAGGDRYADTLAMQIVQQTLTRLRAETREDTSQ